MSLAQLRVALLFELLLATLAAHAGYQLLGWRGVDAAILATSPDAGHSIEGLLLRWGFLGGSCLGLAGGLALVAFGQRQAIWVSGALVKAHWLAAALPPVVILCVAMELA